MKLNFTDLGFIFIFALFITMGIEFISFNIYREKMGGEASMGKIENGKYYVGDRGRYTEVSKDDYENSKTRSSINIATFFSTMALIGITMIFMSNSEKDKNAKENNSVSGQ